MFKSVLFFHVMCLSSLLFCVYPMKIKIKGENSTILNLNLNETQNENEFKLFQSQKFNPIMDNKFVKMWEAEKIYDLKNTDKFHFCEILTLAEKIEENLTFEIRNYFNKIEKHNESIRNLNSFENKISNKNLNLKLDKNDKETSLEIETYEKFFSLYKNTLKDIKNNLRNNHILENIHKICKNNNKESVKEEIDKNSKVNLDKNSNLTDKINVNDYLNKTTIAEGKVNFEDSRNKNHKLSKNENQNVSYFRNSTKFIELDNKLRILNKYEEGIIVFYDFLSSLFFLS